MIIEFGAQKTKATIGGQSVETPTVDGKPTVIELHIPEADDQGLGGFTHAIGGIDAETFRNERYRQLAQNGGMTHFPDHEILLAATAAWEERGVGSPDWIRVTDHPGIDRDGVHYPLTPAGRSDDVASFLSAYHQAPVGAPADLEDRYHTRFGPPGVALVPLPKAEALFLDSGRTGQALNYGGGQVGATGVGTAATATTFTSASTWTTNQWANYRIVVFNSSGAGVWGNVVSNTNAASASVATVDRWYNFATPGGAAGTTPASGYYWAILDGGMTSEWFCGLSTSSGLSPAHGDTSLASEYSTSAGGIYRKISPYALVSGTSPMSFTLIPVFTANGSDTLPTTVYGCAFFTSMVLSFAQAGGPMRFEDTFTSATFAASGDNLTLTETITGS